MKIKTKLLLYSIIVIVATTAAMTLGTVYLNFVQTTRQNQEQLVRSVNNLEVRLNSTIDTLQRHVLNFTNEPSRPIKVLSEVKELVHNKYLPEDLYELGTASNVLSFALYYPPFFEGPDLWQYTYSQKHGGLFGHDNNESLFYAPIGVEAYRATPQERPYLYPDQFEQTDTYSFEMTTDRETLLVYQVEYVSPTDFWWTDKGGHLGFLVLKKSFDVPWNVYDREMGVYFNLYDKHGALKGGQLKLPNLTTQQANGEQSIFLLKDEDGTTYDAIAIPFYREQQLIGYISASIPTDATTTKVVESINLLFFISVIILLIVALISSYAVGRIVSSISNAAPLLRQVAKSEDNFAKHLITPQKNELFEIREFFISFNEMLLHLDKQKKTLEQNFQQIEFLKNYNEQIIESIKSGILSINNQFQIEKANRVFLDFFGLEDQDILGKDIRTLEYPFLDHNVLENVDKIITNQSNTFQISKRTSPHKIYEINLYSFPIPLNTDQATYGCLMLLSDISAKTELEQKIFQAEKLSTISMLSAGVAHEINNPLSSIIANVQPLLKIEKDEKKIKHLKWIEQESFRISEIIGGLLNFASKDPKPDMKTDINAVISQVISLIQFSLKKEVSIEKLLASEPVTAKINKDELKQVIINIITNAIHACENKGTITVCTQYLKVPNCVFITVEDTGHGIPDAIIKNIFDPFYTTKNTGEGTGLGLSVVYGIIQKNKGDIKIESHIGKGTTVMITLPAYN